MGPGFNGTAVTEILCLEASEATFVYFLPRTKEEKKSYLITHSLINSLRRGQVLGVTRGGVGVVCVRD
jgi:hypothetical protein